MRDIDEWLASEETGEPFSHCIRCRLPLLEIAEPWLVNKEFHRGECVLEYAICKSCRDEMTARVTADSKEAVRHFLETEIRWDERVGEFMMMRDPIERFDACIACRVPRAEVEGFGISALLDAGGELVTGPLPLMICRLCLGRMSGLLTPESLAVWKQFLADHFEGPAGEWESGHPGLL